MELDAIGNRRWRRGCDFNRCLRGDVNQSGLLISGKKKSGGGHGSEYAYVIDTFKYRKGRSLEEVGKLAKKSGRRSITLAKEYLVRRQQ